MFNCDDDVDIDASAVKCEQNTYLSPPPIDKHPVTHAVVDPGRWAWWVWEMGGTAHPPPL